VATVEEQAAAVVKPIVARLDVASRADIDRLSKRVSQLEKRVGAKAKHAVAA
jgi:polyhydroxyalkanoate synthesis regulator phasin